MGIWQLFAAATVMNCVVNCVYPQRGNPNVRKDLNRKIMPIGAANQEVYLMWTSTREDMGSSHWIPNHFVPLLPLQIPAEFVDDSYSEEEKDMELSGLSGILEILENDALEDDDQLSLLGFPDDDMTLMSMMEEQVQKTRTMGTGNQSETNQVQPLSKSFNALKQDIADVKLHVKVDVHSPAAVNDEHHATVDTRLPSTNDQPPAAVDVQLPTTLDIQFPAAVVDQPLATVDVQLPATVVDQPPATVVDQPPAAVDDQLPATVGDQPPAAVDVQLPTTVNDQPPATVNDQPLATVDVQLPATVGDQPPATVDVHFPTTVDDQPPAAVDDHLPATVVDQPPAAVDDQLPTTLDIQPPGAVDEQPPATIDVQPPTADDVQPRWMIGLSLGIIQAVRKGSGRRGILCIPLCMMMLLGSSIPQISSCKDHGYSTYSKTCKKYFPRHVPTQEADPFFKWHAFYEINFFSVLLLFLFY
ncbi:uncharacterized protein LOC117343256 [Pecten maximus]|uniref:uncharacterized protein LOC117343256 n=1 Tax=Pecten maximus TaxID=6579 RepID=UPI001457F193|nr:uncharacterized protein LOC117343256 [Pecten maximus]